MKLDMNVTNVPLQGDIFRPEEGMYGTVKIESDAQSFKFPKSLIGLSTLTLDKEMTMTGTDSTNE